MQKAIKTKDELYDDEYKRNKATMIILSFVRWAICIFITLTFLPTLQVLNASEETGYIPYIYLWASTIICCFYVGSLLRLTTREAEKKHRHQLRLIDKQCEDKGN
jgi:predicted membrane channel-forming protein YqfA (hemolysin III family)